MRIEEQVFQRKRFIPEKAVEYGFQESEEGWNFEKSFMDGDFLAVIKISRNGEVTGKVMDLMNDEEYTRIRTEDISGAFSASVRESYRDILEDIAGNCCRELLFATDQANRVAGIIKREYDVLPDFPWGNGAHRLSGVFRHVDSGKWFALIMNVKRRVLPDSKDDTLVDVINLKINENDIDSITGKAGIYPAYHMNHRKWISVLLDDTISDDRITKLVQDSYNLTR